MDWWCLLSQRDIKEEKKQFIEIHIWNSMLILWRLLVCKLGSSVSLTVWSFLLCCYGNFEAKKQIKFIWCGVSWLLFDGRCTCEHKPRTISNDVAADCSQLFFFPSRENVGTCFAFFVSFFSKVYYKNVTMANKMQRIVSKSSSAMFQVFLELL